MPNRLLKEGIVDSPLIDLLSSDEEVFFYRLLVVADDFGLMDARPAILRARCFPLKETLSIAKVDTWLNKLVSVGLLARYEANGQPYVLIGKWEQRQRSRAKYPMPPDGLMPTLVSQLSDDCQADDGLGRGLGKGKGLGLGAVTPGEGGWNGITPEKRALWAKAYPAIDLEVELSKAFAWVVANPKNIKSNWERFIANWFTRSQDRAAAQGGGNVVRVDSGGQRAKAEIERTRQMLDQKLGPQLRVMP